MKGKSTRTPRISSKLKSEPLPVAMYIATLATLCAIVFSGQGKVWGMGLSLMVLGTIVLVRQPREGMSRFLEYGLIALLVASAFSFLPVGDLFRPEWREYLGSEVGLDLPSSLSIQPWISFEYFVMVVAGVLWTYYCFSIEMTRNARKHALWIVSGFIGMLGFISLSENAFAVKGGFSVGQVGFSVFSNATANSVFFVLGSLLSFGLTIESFHRRNYSTVVGLVSLLCSFSAAVVSGKEEVLMFFFLGAFVWIFLRMRRSIMLAFKKQKKEMILGCGAMFVLLFLINREWYKPLIHFSESEWFRMLFSGAGWNSIFSVIGDQWIWGIGLGNSKALSFFYNTTEAGSDLVWLWAEVGVLGLVAFGLILVSVFKGMNLNDFLRSTKSRPSQVVAIVAIATVAVMGLFLSPLHSFGISVLCILLAVIARDYYNIEKLPVMMPSIVMHILALLVAGVGAVWTASGVWNMSLHSQIAQKNYHKLAMFKLAKSDYSSFDEILDKGVRLNPLNPWWYFQKGRGQLLGGKNEAEAKVSFNQAVALSKEKEQMLFNEGVVWLNYDINEVKNRWAEALSVSHDIWKPIRRTCKRFPSCESVLKDLSALDYDLKYAYLERVSESDFVDMIKEDIKIDASLSMYGDYERRQLLERWAESRDVESFLEYLNESEGIVEDPWYFISLAYGSQEKYEEALGLALENMGKPDFPDLGGKTERPLFELKRDFYADSQDYDTGIVLLEKYVAKEDWSNARLVVDELVKMDEVPEYVMYWGSVVYEKSGDLSLGWNARKLLLRRMGNNLVASRM